MQIKLTSDELRLMSLFQSVTSATARDCIVDEKMDRVIFVVNKGQMGLAIGKGGSTIKQLHPKDWGYAALALAHRFFIPEM